MSKVLISGLLITFLINIIKKILYNKRLFIDVNFLIWCIINSFAYFISLKVLRFFYLNDFIYYFFFGAIIIFIGKIFIIFNLNKIYIKTQWISFLLIIIFIIFVMNLIYFPYKETNIENNGFICKNNTLYVKKDLFNFRIFSDIEDDLSCLEYQSSRPVKTCFNNKPVFICEATIWDQLFKVKPDYEKKLTNMLYDNLFN